MPFDRLAVSGGPRTTGARWLSRFHGVDFLNLDSGFTEDERLVRRTTRDFVDDNLVPIIEECFREGRFPRELVPMMGQLGFFGASLGRAMAAQACRTWNMGS